MYLSQTIQALREKIAQAKSDFKKEEMKQRVLIRANQWLERENERYEGVTNDILQGRHSVPVDSVALS